jgi:hypothetical protein
MYKKGLEERVYTIALWVFAFIVVLAVFTSTTLYAKNSASSSTCSFSGTLRSFQDRFGADAITPDTKLACKTIDFGALDQYGNNDAELKRNNLKQVSDMMYDCASEVNFGTRNIFAGNKVTEGIFCFPCFSFYLPSQASALSTQDLDTYLKSYEFTKDAKKMKMFQLLSPILVPLDENDKQYIIEGSSLKWFRWDQSGINFEYGKTIEPNEDYSIVYLNGVAPKGRRYNPLQILGASNKDAKFLVIVKTKDFSKLSCNVEND